MPVTINTPRPFRVKPAVAEQRPVRVSFLIDELTPAGTETQLLALIRNLDRSIVEPSLCLLRGQSAVSRALEPDDCPILRLEAGSLRSWQTIGKLWRLRRFLCEQKIDILQIYFPDSTYVGVLAGRLAGVPHIVRTRNNAGYWMTPFHRAMGRLCNLFSEVTIANCEASRQAVIDAEGLAPNRIVVLENGVDLQRFPTPAPLPRAGRVGIVANLRPVKALDVFLRAATRVLAEHPDATFTIAGEGPERSGLTQLAKELKLTDRIEMPGVVRDVPGFLASLDVAVLCSRSEGMSNAVLEYMAAARPIVATTVGANERLIDDGVHGLLVPPDDPASLAHAISRLLREPALSERLAQAARQRVWERYSREAMVRRFEAFYQRLVQRKG
jgi:glycosyltransferase involved in cell wall biosynthesis